MTHEKGQRKGKEGEMSTPNFEPADTRVLTSPSFEEGKYQG
jgi:hypothetical protein